MMASDAEDDSEGSSIEQIFVRAQQRRREIDQQVKDVLECPVVMSLDSQRRVVAIPCKARPLTTALPREREPEMARTTTCAPAADITPTVAVGGTIRHEWDTRDNGPVAETCSSSSEEYDHKRSAPLDPNGVELSVVKRKKKKTRPRSHKDKLKRERNRAIMTQLHAGKSTSSGVGM